jgi:hypothetical protein
MSEMRPHVWEVIRLGTSGLRRHGFKRPGGGSRFRRDRTPLRQVVSCFASWGDTTGWLSAAARQLVGELWKLDGPRLPLDLLHGDARDEAIALAHWLEATLLPKLDTALGRAFEARPVLYWTDERPAIEVWTLLGFPHEAERVASELAAKRAAAGPDDIPF